MSVPRIRRMSLAVLLFLASAASASAQLTDDERRELDGLRSHEQELSAVEGRIASGESAVVANPNPTGAPFLEVPRGDPSSMISSLLLTGDITSAQAVELSRTIGDQLRVGRQRLDAELKKARDRIRMLESRNLATGGTMASGDEKEKWRFAMVGRFDRTGAAMRSTGVLDLTFYPGGRVYGRAHYDSADSWDDDVDGTITNRQVRLTYGASNSATTGSFTGEIDPAGTSATGIYRISGLLDASGEWRATRLPDAAAAAPAGTRTPTSPLATTHANPVDSTLGEDEQNLIEAIVPDHARDFQSLIREGVLPFDSEAVRKQVQENWDKTAMEIFGRHNSDLSPAQRRLVATYQAAMNMAMLADRNGNRAFPGIAASLPVIRNMTHAALQDPDAALAAQRYLALLENMEVADLRRRFGLPPTAPLP